MTQTVGDLGEFGLIAAIRDRITAGPDILVGPGDDAAVLRVPGGRIVATTDLLIEGRHFRRDWSRAHDVGRKAAAQNLADVAAMGAVPTALLLGLGVPADLPADWVRELADGLRDECDVVGASVAGGDTVAAETIVVAITALGRLDDREPIRRGGARPGDVVALCGRLGWAAAGLAVLSRGFRSPRVVVEAHRRPEPPYDAGPEAARLGATALIDVSDGLLADLGHVAEASRVRIDLAAADLDVAEPLHAVGSALGVDPLGFVLTGGDDHALAATFPADVVLPERWRVIGSVRAADSTAGDAPLVTVDGAAWSGPAGWDHFARRAGR